jgi:adenylylsulfate kinase-like enzyme
LLAKEGFLTRDIVRIVEAVKNEGQQTLARDLIKEDFLKKDIAPIVQAAENEVQRTLARDLIKEGRLTAHIADILKSTNENNLELRRRLVSGDLAEKRKGIFDFYAKNIKKMGHHDLGVTSEILDRMLMSNFDGFANILSISGEDVLKRAAQLKYKGLDNFLNDAKTLSKLTDENKSLLKERLTLLVHNEQRIDILRTISGLAEHMKSDDMQSIISRIQSPEMTAAQKKLANEIFASKENYDKQIDVFIEKFDVPEHKQKDVRALLQREKFNTKFSDNHLTFEEQKDISEKRYKTVENNSNITPEKKNESLSKIRSDIEYMEAHKEEYSQPQLKNEAMKSLSDYVATNINSINHSKEFMSAVKIHLYEIYRIKATPELLKSIEFDPKYMPTLFSGSGWGFDKQFIKMINLLMENPGKTLTQARESLPTNQQTRAMFETNGLNYDKWNKSDKNLKHDFMLKVRVAEAITAANAKLKTELDEIKFSEIGKGVKEALLEKFEQNGLLNGDALREDLSIKELQEVIKLAKTEMNPSEGQLKTVLYTALKNYNEEAELFKAHIATQERRISNLVNLKDFDASLSVRLANSDDVGRNLFLGNHVGCCTSIGSFNAFAAPQHLMNSYVRAIEIVDAGGNSYGNSMCFFAKVNDKLTFVIDSFEASGQLGGSPEVSKAIVDYARKVCAEMGQPDAQIMFGPHFNKLDLTNCERTIGNTLEIIGRAPDTTYIDSIGGRGDIGSPYSGRDMLEIIK